MKNVRMSQAVKDHCLQKIETYIERTGTVASRLSNEATGSANPISQMRQGKAVPVKHYKAILQCMEKFPNGLPKAPRARAKVVVVSSPSTDIPVPGPSQMAPDLFDEIKREAFRRRMPVVRLMEEIVKLGWQRYEEVSGGRDDRRGSYHPIGSRYARA